MSGKINRRALLIGGSASIAGLGAAAFLSKSSPAKIKNAALPVIPLWDLSDQTDPIAGLPLIKSTHDFGFGNRRPTFGIGSSYLGPLVRVRSGQDVAFSVRNQIGEVTTLHWHGLHIPGDVDGGPHQEIEPGARWEPIVPIRQRASLNWFHAHTHGHTARQVYQGLAGVMQVEDDESLSADLPRTYGVDDFVLVLQDKQFDSRGQLVYELSGDTFENGFTGDRMVINGQVAPVSQPVPKGLVRLRLLNACNARFLRLSWSDNRPVHVIASDGGFLSKRADSQSIVMSPGERYELLVDMSAQSEVSLQVAAANGEGGEEGEETLGWLATKLFGSSFSGLSDLNVLTLHSDDQLPAFDGVLPDKLAHMPELDVIPASRMRQFELNMGDEDELAALAASWGNICGGGGMGINGRPMNMDVINEKVTLGESEVWRITSGDQVHPFHIHGCSFRIVRQQGERPPAYASGWKDMVAVGEGVSEILVRFDHRAPETAPYMYHCHILEHEDCGMMGQFTVT
jgi:FtsP/CotA-like multicopper oxidase with cupredoxin domain